MNPIVQGIGLSEQAAALRALRHATTTIDPLSKDPALDSIRATLDAQIARTTRELDVLISLYGGPDAR